MNGPAKRSLVFGSRCAGVGLLLGTVVGMWVSGEAGALFAVVAPLAAFVCGSAFWRVLPERRPNRRPGSGAIAGGLAGLVSHYVTWCFWCVGASFLRPYGVAMSQEEGLVDLLSVFPVAAAMTFYSAIVCGWVTVPVGAALGRFFAGKTAGEG